MNNKEREKELETLNKITNMQKDLLGSLYGDFFSGTPVKEPSVSAPAQTPSNTPAKSSDEAIKDANDALVDMAKATYVYAVSANKYKD